jgi:hypothetical protein
MAEAKNKPTVNTGTMPNMPTTPVSTAIANTTSIRTPHRRSPMTAKPMVLVEAKASKAVCHAITGVHIRFVRISEFMTP